MIFVWSLKFYHKPVRSCSILAKKKARFYVGFGVSQTPSVHYEMEVTVNGFELLVHSTDLFPVGQEVGIHVDPFDIQIMNKPESEDEEAAAIEE